MGLANQFTFVGLTHLLFMMQIRDWNKWMRICVCIVLFMFVFVIIVAQTSSVASPTNFYKRIAEVVTVPLFWLTLPPALTIMYIPYYLERAYWEQIRFPKLFKQ